jgi:hypothetical protein
VTYPFPAPVSVGGTVTGSVDSLTTRRNNLVTSSHFYAFTTTGGAASIRLDITGLGAAIIRMRTIWICSSWIRTAA